MDARKRIALTAHDAVKPALVAWAFANEAALAAHHLTATGNTGQLLMRETGLSLDLVRSCALGGDMELGAMIAEGAIDILIFFTDPVSRQPHDVDPAPLWRVATLSQTAVAINEASADFLIRSELMGRHYPRPHGQTALPSSRKRLGAQADIPELS
ncbi:methylglyoxal synthase [Acuticoccus yangtzensis]|uniref:methylglyoxal synthase n=1 Tax=Acuticoccus yangtzensis TaxID=1443441 RepID=UPI00094984D4|nr:methylglyoxal synthase [Acuticoccus yangtzensis]ORE95447.1 methylglyoxal synthase [Stappia sp. 22II-S9-Z10]